MSHILTTETLIEVRFSEVDALKIVWHGHYINYFEDGRQGFGQQYNLGYLDFFAMGYTVPIVEYSCKNKMPLTFGDQAIVKTTFVENPAAKIIFDYEIKGYSDQRIIATGRTVQVFLDKNGILELNQPEFFVSWKKKWGLV